MVKQLVKCPECNETKLTTRASFYCCKHNWKTALNLSENDAKLHHRKEIPVEKNLEKTSKKAPKNPSFIIDGEGNKHSLNPKTIDIQPQKEQKASEQFVEEELNLECEE